MQLKSIMKLKIFSTLLLWILNSSMHVASNKIHEGVYLGGICLDGGICGTWIIKRDSSFVFMEYSDSCISKIGAGKITLINQDIFTFQFSNLEYKLLPGRIEYESDTKMAFDSINIVGSIVDESNKPIPYVSIKLNDSKSIVSTLNGSFEITYPIREKINFLVFSKNMDNFFEQKLELNDVKNAHRIKVTMAKKQPDLCNSIDYLDTMSRYTFKVVTEKNAKPGFSILKRESDDYSKVYQQLKTIRGKKPFYSSSIDIVLKLLSK